MATELNRTVRATLSTNGDVSPTFKYRRNATPHTTLRVQLGGTWSGTVVLQSSDPDQSRWIDEPNGTFTANTAKVYEPGADVDLRWRATTVGSGEALVAIINSAGT